jgi:hypothetical protein
MMPRCAWVLIVLCCLPASARDENGRLDILLAPNVGKPAIVREGEILAVRARQTSEVYAVQDERRVLLDITWTPERGAVQGEGSWPSGFEDGFVALEVVSDGRSDREDRAVFVSGEASASYLMAVAGEIAIDETNPVSQQSLLDLMEKLGQGPALFAVLTGPLTANGTDREFQLLIDAIKSASLPVFVACGPADRENFALYFGDPVFSFTCNDDGFIVADASGPIPMWDPAGQAGTLQRLRRSIKPRRWSIGFGYSYSPQLDMRAQLALFVDDPLDHFFVSTWTPFGEEVAPATPWNTTALTVAPPLESGRLLMVQIRHDEISPIQPRQPVADE